MKLIELIRSHPLYALLAAVAVVSLLVFSFSQIQSWSYHKAKKEYDAKELSWMTERTRLIADAEAKEKRIAELEPKVLAYEQAAEQGKKVDQGLADKIDQISKEAAADAALTDEPAECATRAERTCAKLKALKPPIVIDCAEYKRKICS